MKTKSEQHEVALFEGKWYFRAAGDPFTHPRDYSEGYESEAEALAAAEKWEAQQEWEQATKKE